MRLTKSNWGEMTPVMKAAAILALIPAGLAVLSGAYFGTRALLGIPVDIPGIARDRMTMLLIASLIGGFVLFAGAGSMMTREPAYWRAAIGCMTFVLVLSVIVQVTAATPVVTIGASSVATAVSLFALIVLVLPDVRRWYVTAHGSPPTSPSSHRPIQK